MLAPCRTTAHQSLFIIIIFLLSCDQHFPVFSRCYCRFTRLLKKIPLAAWQRSYLYSLSFCWCTANNYSTRQFSPLSCQMDSPKKGDRMGDQGILKVHTSITVSGFWQTLLTFGRMGIGVVVLFLRDKSANQVNLQVQEIVSLHNAHFEMRCII